MLYIFVEGYYDKLFLNTLFFHGNPIFIEYSQEKVEKTNNFIKSIKCTPTIDYLFFGDADGKTIDDAAHCLLEKYKELEQSKLYIVQYEIESWYYAGMCERDCLKLKMSSFAYNTDTITKESLIAKLADKTNRQYTLVKMLDYYSISLAEGRNTSFRFFSEHMKEPVAAV